MHPTARFHATYTSQSSGDIVVTGRLSGALNHAVAMERMTSRGMSPDEADALLKDVKVDTLQVDKQGREVKSSGFGSYFKGYIMALLLSMTTMIYGMNVARSDHPGEDLAHLRSHARHYQAQRHAGRQTHRRGRRRTDADRDLGGRWAR